MIRTPGFCILSFVLAGIVCYGVNAQMPPEQKEKKPDANAPPPPIEAKKEADAKKDMKDPTQPSPKLSELLNPPGIGLGIGQGSFPSIGLHAIVGSKDRMIAMISVDGKRPFSVRKGSEFMTIGGSNAGTLNVGRAGRFRSAGGAPEPMRTGAGFRMRVVDIVDGGVEIEVLGINEPFTFTVR
jgi:hypothetical protein